jgi:hypothetical protein
MPGVLMQDEPFVPLPLVMHANAPVASLAEQVSPAGHENGLDAQPAAPDESDVDEEHAVAATAVATVAAAMKARDPRMRMAGTVARA